MSAVVVIMFPSLAHLGMRLVVHVVTAKADAMVVLGEDELVEAALVAVKPPEVPTLLLPENRADGQWFGQLLLAAKMLLLDIQRHLGTSAVF